MDRHVVLMLAASLLGALTFVASARAQDAPPAEDSEEPPSEGSPKPAEDEKLARAKELFRRADALRLAGDCANALPIYAASRDLVASVPNTLNAAICAAKTERGGEALELYASLLAGHRDQLTEDELRSVQAEMTRLRAALGQLDVSGEPGALLVVDGRRRGELPLIGPIYVRPGAQEVRVVKQGYEPLVTTVAVRKGEMTRLQASLRPLTASGRVVVEAPSGAELWVDGSPVGQLPFDGLFAPGKHVYQVIDDGLGSPLASMTVVVGQTVQLNPQLTPLGPTVTIATQPPEAALVVNGVPVGDGRWQGRLPAGEVVVEARSEGYVAARRTVTLAASGTLQRIDVTLEVDRTHPRWAQVEEGPGGRFWLEAVGGVVVGPGLEGGAASSCASAVACDTSTLLGWGLGLRAGYELPFKLSIELSGGYVAMGQDLTRTLRDPFIDAAGQEQVVDYQLRDQRRLRGGYLLGGVGYRLPVIDGFEVRGHVGLGPVFLSGRDVVSGAALLGDQGDPVGVIGSGDAHVSVGLLVAPSLDFGIDLDPFVFGLGVQAFVVPLDGASSELGDVVQLDDCNPSAQPTDAACAPNESLVGDEALYGPHVSFMPQLHAGYRF